MQEIRTVSYTHLLAILEPAWKDSIEMDVNLKLRVRQQGILRDPEYFSTGWQDLFRLAQRFALIDADVYKRQGLPGYVPDYSDDFTDEIKDVFCYGFYSSEDKYIVKLKVDYIKHNTTVAFPTILFVKNEIDEIPYKITSKNNPDVVEGCIKVKS